MSVFSLWTVYDHPRDFPHSFVARRFENEKPTHEFIVAPNLEAIREQMQDRGLYRFDREPKDDPVIVEVWL